MAYLDLRGIRELQFVADGTTEAVPVKDVIFDLVHGSKLLSVYVNSSGESAQCDSCRSASRRAPNTPSSLRRLYDTMAIIPIAGTLLLFSKCQRSRLGEL